MKLWLQLCEEEIQLCEHEGKYMINYSDNDDKYKSQTQMLEWLPDRKIVVDVWMESLAYKNITICWNKWLF